MSRACDALPLLRPLLPFPLLLLLLMLLLLPLMLLLPPFGGTQDPRTTVPQYPVPLLLLLGRVVLPTLTREPL